MNKQRVEEVAQWLRAFAALAEDLGSGSHSNIVAHKYL